MKFFLWSTAFCALFFSTASADTRCTEAIHTTETAQNTYDVFLNGKSIGHHTIRFEKYGSQIVTESRTFMQVKLLFLSAFKYEYFSRESWCGDKLLDVKSTTNSNGKHITSHAKLTKNGYAVRANYDGDQSESVIEGELIPSNHWNIANLEKPALFDTIKAYNFDISVTQPANITDTPFDGTQYDVSGDYVYSTFYDANNHWQGMSFYREGKHFIEFRCRDCQNTLWPDEAIRN